MNADRMPRRSDRALRVVAEGETPLLAPPAAQRRRRAKDIVPFGQYKGQHLSELLDDIPYCAWLVEQRWCRTKFPEIVRAASAALTAFEQGDAPISPIVAGELPMPTQVWSALSADQRVAVRVCAPTLAAALEAAG